MTTQKPPRLCSCGDPVYKKPNSTIGRLCYICTMSKEAMKNLYKIKKTERKRINEIKESIKTLRDHIRDAQTVFNTWVRNRDKDKPCISCDRPLNTKFDAGHYLSAGGNSALRFHEDNCHGQCVHCNQHLSANLINYRIGLVKRIGMEKVEFLECNAKMVKKWTVEELKSIKQKYSSK